jgi:Transposase DDE domain
MSLFGTIVFATTQSKTKEAQMECSTKHTIEQGVEGTSKAVGKQEWLDKDWAEVEKGLGIDLEQSARETKAIQRLRQIRNASDLLRLILFYALSDWSLRLVGVWAFMQGIGYLSDVAILKRLRNSHVWIGKLVVMVLQKRCSALKAMPGIRLRIMDATCVSRPGSQTTDWRTHLCFDLGNLCLDGIELTDKHGGETLVRFAPQSNEIRIADGAYSFASGMGPVLAEGAGLVVRINWRNVPVRTPDGQRFEIIPWLQTISGPTEHPVWFSTPHGWFPLRLIASPLPPEKAEEARRRARLRNQRKQLHNQPTDNTLFAAGFVILLTNLPAQSWSLALILTLYRVRWQIELVIKRLKSVIQYDHLRAKDPQLAQTYLLAKLLVALVLDELNHRTRCSQPDWFVSLDHPVNISRLTQFHLDIFRQLVCGPLPLRNLHQYPVILKRYFCDTPRARPQQLAWFRAWIEHISLSSPCPLS